MNIITAHKESFDRKVVVITEEHSVEKREWCNADGEIPTGAKIIDRRKGRFGIDQVLCVWETVEPKNWKTFSNKASAERFTNAHR